MCDCEMTDDEIGELADAAEQVPKLEAEIERLRAALQQMRSRDDRNGSLPPAYRMIIDDALGLDEQER